MNNTKWREVLAVLANSENLRSPIRWRFVDDERIFYQPVPPAGSLLVYSLPDMLPAPFALYNEIDWIEVPSQEDGRNDLDKLWSELWGLGFLPLSRSNSCLRITGYIW
ncbi:DUF6678 family protein [Luteolibacter rhizosphaerae]|uniref:DUF6678 family protein n=1 Tax=Luteolibacter rhizosphaerae TaxID=2989719 RepID=UPI003CE536CA